jgi:RNA polymerase sigma factor (TIGR02999 family)
MDRPAGSDVTQMLADWGKGDQDALARLMPLVYDELRRLAASYLRRERPGHTLQATALVNEAYMRLIDQKRMNWQNRAHFFGIAAQMMRRILVDHARGHLYAKRGGGAKKLSLDAAMQLPEQEQEVDLRALDEALNKLETFAPRQSRIIELRYFGGLSIEATAEVLGLSPATVKREWNMARAWLYREMRKGEV